mgnify:CR=1 FL=1
MIYERARAFAVQHQAFAASAASGETAVSVGNLATVGIVVKMEIGAFEASAASAACVVSQGIAAFGREKRAADLVAMSLLAHLAGNSIEGNEAALGKRAS